MLKIRTLFLFIFALLFSSFFLFYNLGYEQLFFGDESIHLSVIKEMLISGDWMHPTFRGHSYFSKPPLKMWVTLVLSHAFEPSLFWLRFPDALFSLISMALIFTLGMKLFSSALTGSMAVVFLISCPIYLFRHCARMGVQDSTLFLCTTALMLAFWSLYKKNKDKETVYFSKEWIYIALFVAIGLMVKYIAGFYGLICGCTFLFVTTPINKVLRKWLKPFIVISFLSIIPLLIWLLYLQQNYFSEFYDVFVVENFQRFMGEGIHNVGGKGFYFRELVINEKFLSAILLCPLLIFWLYKIYKKDISYIYLFVWGICPIVGFSLLNSRLIWYMIPAFPAIALVAGNFLVTIFMFIFSHDSKHSKYYHLQFAIKILLALYLISIVFFQGEKLVDVTKRLLKEPKQYQVERIVKDIKDNGIKVTFYDRDDSSIFRKTSLPDYDRFFLLDILSQMKFQKAPEYLVLGEESDVLIFPACHLKTYQQENKNKFIKCAYFESTLGKGTRFNLPDSGYVATCLKNCDTLKSFSSCDKLPRKVMKQDCGKLDEAYKEAKKDYSPKNYAKKPSFFAPLRDY